MNEQEMLEAVRAGQKVTHRWFSDDEWMTMENEMFVFEDGVRCSQEEFWKYREGLGFREDWSIYKG